MSPVNDAKRGDLGIASEAGKLLQRFLGACRQSFQLATMRSTTLFVKPWLECDPDPCPDALMRVEYKEVLFAKRRNKLNGEKRVAQSFPVY